MSRSSPNKMASPASASSSLLEEEPTLPVCAHDLLPELELLTLVLISHGHSPPLNPPPRLRFDVRFLPNPPKHIRDAHNGTSKRLQEWMRTDAKFLTRRDEIKSEIEAAMTRMTAETEQRKIARLRSEQKDLTTEDSEPMVEMEQQIEEGEACDEEGPPDQDNIDNNDSTPRDQATLLRVGIFCAMGRHRSVAMVEELKNLPWPGWHVVIEHRDIFKKHGAGKKSSGQRSRGNRGGTMPTAFDGSSE